MILNLILIKALNCERDNTGIVSAPCIFVQDYRPTALKLTKDLLSLYSL